MYCKNCGKTLNQGELFCSNCGAKVENENNIVGDNNFNQNQQVFNQPFLDNQPLNQNMGQQPTGQPVNQMNNQQPQNNFSQTFKNENQKKQETMCEIGFWISILGLLGSFAGIMMGLLVYVLDFYFASQGLKTRKRKRRHSSSQCVSSSYSSS